MKRLILTVISVVLFFQVHICNAAFENISNNSLPSISIGVIKSCGEYTLTENLFASLKDQLREKMQYSHSFRLAEDYSGHVMIKGHNVPIEQFFSVVLMDAIVRGNNFSNDTAGPTLRQFAKNKSIARRSANSNPYKISSDFFSVLKSINQDINVKYLFLCNVKDVNINENGPTKYGKKVELEIDYYLINLFTNDVYEGHIDNSKKDGLINQWLITTVKNIDGFQLFQKLFEIVAQQLVNDIENKAIPTLRNGDM